MRQAEIDQKRADFKAVFDSRVRWMRRVLPERAEKLGVDKATKTFLRRFEEACPDLLSAIDQERTDIPAWKLPFLMCLAIAFADVTTYGTDARARSPMQKAVVSLADAMHERQHKAWGGPVPVDTVPLPAKGRTILRTDIRRYCLREREEAMRRIRQDGKNREAAFAWQMYGVCAEFAKSFSMRPEEDSPFVEEIPRRRCPDCGKKAWPVIGHDSGTDDRGWLFSCPFCGHSYGRGGMRKLLHDNSGRRIAGSTWKAADISECCEICGKRGDLQCHHKKPVSEGGADDPSNLLVLCAGCHKAVHLLRDGKREKGIVERIRRTFRNFFHFPGKRKESEIRPTASPSPAPR